MTVAAAREAEASGKKGKKRKQPDDGGAGNIAERWRW
jgi:hypothetical protein